MKRTGVIRQRLGALALLGLPLLTYPILGLSVGDVLGVPSSYIYLFTIWVVLIVLAALVAERRGG